MIRLHAHMPGPAYARRLGCVSAHCALGAPNLFLTQFLDSIVFLSHCLNTIHHKKFSKFFFNKIKSNETKFWKK